MKLLNKLSLMAAAGLALVGCDLDRGDVAVVDNAVIKPASFTAYPSQALVLDKTEMNNSLAVFAWDAADYGYSAAVTYTLEAFSGETKATIAATNGTSAAIINNDLNNVLLNSFKAVPGEPYTMQVRLLSTIGVSKYDTISLSVPLVVTPFSGDPVPLYVIGEYNGWNHDNDVALLSEKGDGVYTGWIYLYNPDKAQDDMTEFLFTPKQTWDNKWGSVGGDITQLVLDGGDNIQMKNGYIYRFQVDTKALTTEVLSDQITTIGLIGDATPGGWDNDTDLVYDGNERKFIAKGVAMKAGGWKVRANDTWGVLEFGVGPEAGQFWPMGGGDNITFDQPDGTYTVKVDLYQLNPTYEFIAE